VIQHEKRTKIEFLLHKKGIKTSILLHGSAPKHPLYYTKDIGYYIIEKRYMTVDELDNIFIM
jgi:hypothetical protein